MLIPPTNAYFLLLGPSPTLAGDGGCTTIMNVMHVNYCSILMQ